MPRRTRAHSLTSLFPFSHSATQHSTAQHSSTQLNTAQHSTTQFSSTWLVHSRRGILSTP
eukprot:7215211-Pyramimonas_sp.AAC.1